MPTKSVQEKLKIIIEAIKSEGCANLTRLTVLKKWFERPERASAFGIWMAAMIARTRSDSKTFGDSEKNEEGRELFKEARKLLARPALINPRINRPAAENLLGRLMAFQNDFQRQEWGPIRMIFNWNLLMIEEGLDIYLWRSHYPSESYKLAADYCGNYDCHYGRNLNGPSVGRIKEIIDFINAIEALEK